jgi:dienelactone hydrolase
MNLLRLCFILSGMAPLAAMADPLGPYEHWLKTIPSPPPLRIGATKADWENQRAAIRGTLWKLLGNLPARPAIPAVSMDSREDRGDYLFETFHFDNGAGERVPGYVFLPKSGAQKHPAILYCHWHGGEYGAGKIELTQTNHTPAAPGPTLARKGYVVLGIDAPCFGERQGAGPDGEKGSAGEASASKFHLWAGRTLWGMLLRDDLMALDYLASRPEVDANRLGVTGISMGATRTWWLMALDDRLKAGVAVACLTRYQDLIAEGGLKYHGIYYFVPGMLEHFDTESVIASIAPRSLLCLTGDQDHGSPAGGVRTIAALARPAWEVTGRPGAFESVLYPGVGHSYTPDMWGRMLAWFEREIPPGEAK